MSVHETASRAWSASAEAYERVRPSYPPEAVDFLRGLGLGPDRDALDLAAGTGKLTRALVAAGARVIAVEPLRGMRDVLERVVPEATVLEGTAEGIPVEDESVDIVTVAQAFHWFAAEDALREIARVLRPGGGLAAIWNVRDERVGWMAAIRKLLDEQRAQTPDHRRGEWRRPFESTELFAPLRIETFEHAQDLTRSEAIDVFGSRSYVAAMPAGERSALLTRIGAQLPEAETVTIPYITELYWTVRSS